LSFRFGRKEFYLVWASSSPLTNEYPVQGMGRRRYRVYLAPPFLFSTRPWNAFHRSLPINNSRRKRNHGYDSKALALIGSCLMSRRSGISDISSRLPQRYDTDLRARACCSRVITGSKKRLTRRRYKHGHREQVPGPPGLRLPRILFPAHGTQLSHHPIHGSNDTLYFSPLVTIENGPAFHFGHWVR